MQIGLVTVVFVGATLGLSASSNFVGTTAIQHCGNTDGIAIDCRDDDAIQLRFTNQADQSVLSIDFVLRGNKERREHATVEIFVSGPHPTADRWSPGLAFQTDRRRLPLATTLDARGVAKSVMALDDFVSLAMMSAIEGTAFGRHFVATNQQTLALRLAAGRWAACGRC